jgi:hypothetical protein
MEEVRKLSQIVDEDIPGDLRGNGGIPTSSGNKSREEFEKDIKTVVGVATGGVTWFLEWALEELSKIGKKPIIRWEDFPGPWAPRQDKIYVTFVADAAPAGFVEVVLRTDNGSHIKIIEFQPWDPATNQFVHGPRTSNIGHPEGGTFTVPVRTSEIGSAVLQFASEETSAADTPGRYVLGDLAQKLKDRTRVTFYWKDN